MAALWGGSAAICDHRSQHVTAQVLRLRSVHLTDQLKQAFLTKRYAFGVLRFDQVNRIPKSARNEEDILNQCGLHHSLITKKAAGMLGVVGV